MIEWNEQRLKELVRKMGLRRVRGQGKIPIHLSLYRSDQKTAPLLAQVMRLDTNAWMALDYTETDRVSVTQYLGSLKCRTDDALLVAAECRRPLTLELAKALIDAGAFDKEALSIAAVYQQPLSLELAKLLIDTGAFNKGALSWATQYQSPLSLELAKLLIDAGCDPAAQNSSGWDALACLAWGGHPVDPQVTGLFLSAGCRTDLEGRRFVSEKHRLRFDQILKKHAEWKEKQGRLLTENSPVDTSYSLDWNR